MEKAVVTRSVLQSRSASVFLISDVNFSYFLQIFVYEPCFFLRGIHSQGIQRRCSSGKVCFDCFGPSCNSVRYIEEHVIAGAFVRGMHHWAAMLFVPSIGGVSHAFGEDTREADLVLGAQVYAAACANMLLLATDGDGDPT